MNWTNVKLILLREVRDQLRDRRTMFMIAVLPLLLYPLLGMSLFQVSQFLREQSTRVLIVGLPESDLPALVEGKQFNPKWLEEEKQSRLFEVTTRPLAQESGSSTGLTADDAASKVQSGEQEAVIVFPPDFAERLQRLREELRHRRDQTAEASSIDISIPKPRVYY